MLKFLWPLLNFTRRIILYEIKNIDLNKQQNNTNKFTIYPAAYRYFSGLLGQTSKQQNMLLRLD